MKSICRQRAAAEEATRRVGRFGSRHRAATTRPPAFTGQRLHLFPSAPAKAARPPATPALQH